MIVSPRAKSVIDIVRKAGAKLIKIDEVFRHTRAGKVPYWNRDEDSSNPPSKLRSFAIVPEMTAAVSKGFAVYANTFANSNATHAWRAFDRATQTTGSFGNANSNLTGDNKYAWAIIAFPEPRIVRGWSLQFDYAWSSFWLAIEGKLHEGAWTRIFDSTISPVDSGRFDAVTTPMECTAVRIW